jgi:hypothetical protein
MIAGRPISPGTIPGTPPPRASRPVVSHPAVVPPLSTGGMGKPVVPHASVIRGAPQGSLAANPRLQMLRQHILASALRGGTPNCAPQAPPTMQPPFHPVGMIK